MSHLLRPDSPQREPQADRKRYPSRAPATELPPETRQVGAITGSSVWANPVIPPEQMHPYRSCSRHTVDQAQSCFVCEYEDVCYSTCTECFSIGKLEAEVVSCGRDQLQRDGNAILCQRLVWCEFRTGLKKKSLFSSLSKQTTRSSHPRYPASWTGGNYWETALLRAQTAPFH